MKKQILNVGKALNRAEQKSINGGGGHNPELCEQNSDCSPGLGCCVYFGECLTAFDWVNNCYDSGSFPVDPGPEC